MNDKRQEITAEEYEKERAVLGSDAEMFSRSELGKFIYDRARMSEEQLVEQLIMSASASTDLMLVKMSIDIQMHRMLPKYIEEAIASGHAARRNLMMMEAQAQHKD